MSSNHIYKCRNNRIKYQEKGLAITLIRDNVLIGCKPVVLSGIAIGSEAFIGADLTVTKYIFDKYIAVESPAKRIKQRFI